MYLLSFDICGPMQLGTHIGSSTSSHTLMTTECHRVKT